MLNDQDKYLLKTDLPEFCSLSGKARKKLLEWDKHKKEIDRPDWDTHFLSLALVASLRSHDAQTQCGCIIVNDNHVIGMGYNGFPRPAKERYLPNLRPEKYPFMVHSEMNALFNCSVSPKGSTAYITHKPCNACLLHMIQAGIVEIVHIDNHVVMESDEKSEILSEILAWTGKIDMRAVQPNFTHLKNLVQTI